MKPEILVSTMNLTNEKDYNKLLKDMNITGNSVVINQCPDTSIEMKNITTGKNRLYSFNDKGLSKSRNMAINKSLSPISLIADDDMRYVDDYEQIIIEAYNKYKDADIIAFYVSSDNPNNVKPKLKEGRVSGLNTFKIQSVQLSFKNNVIKEKGLKFDENFGAGSKFFMGEENIFLSDCIRSRLKIYSYPVEIARLNNRESTWFKGYNEEYFQVKGACFYRINKLFWIILVLQFIIRKRKEYKKSISSFNAFKHMAIGKKIYKETL